MSIAGDNPLRGEWWKCGQSEPGWSPDTDSPDGPMKDWEPDDDDDDDDEDDV